MEIEQKRTGFYGR